MSTFCPKSKITKGISYLLAELRDQGVQALNAMCLESVFSLDEKIDNYLSSIRGQKHFVGCATWLIATNHN